MPTRPALSLVWSKIHFDMGKIVRLWYQNLRSILTFGLSQYRSKQNGRALFYLIIIITIIITNILIIIIIK